MAMRGIDVWVLRLVFGLKIRNMIIGQGETGPYMHFRADDQYVLTTADLQPGFCSMTRVVV